LLCLDQGIDLMAEAKRFERGIIERALELTEGNQKRAAKLLGLQSSTLHAKIKKYGLNVSRRKNARR
jgi:DNA-binding NtrC family response regulator